MPTLTNLPLRQDDEDARLEALQDDSPFGQYPPYCTICRLHADKHPYPGHEYTGPTEPCLYDDQPGYHIDCCSNFPER